MSPLGRFLELLVAASCVPRVRDDGAGRGTARCPAHDDHRPSLTFGVGDRVPIVASCRACGADLHAILAAVGAGPEDRALILGHGDAGETRPAHRPVRAAATTCDYPPAAEVAELWESADPCIVRHPDAREWVESRGFDPLTIEHWDIARVVGHREDLPAWASHFWPGHRLIVPTFDSAGTMRSFQGRRLTIGDSELPKAYFPAGHRSSALVLADGAGQWVLREGEAPLAGVWIGEGLPDYLKLATTWSDADEAAPAIIALPGSAAWCPQIASRIPRGTRVVIAVHHDEPGEAYASRIIADLGGRCRLLRWTPKPLKSATDPGVTP